LFIYLFIYLFFNHTGWVHLLCANNTPLRMLAIQWWLIIKCIPYILYTLLFFYILKPLIKALIKRLVQY